MSETLTRHGRESLRLYDYSDRELVAIIDDVADEEGWASRKNIGQTIFPFVAWDEGSDRTKHVLRCVAIRLAWLRRYGVLEKRLTAGESEWTLTEDGQRFLQGRLNAAEQRIIESLKEDRLVAATSLLTSRYQSSSPVAANLIRREWMYGVNRNGR